MKYLTSFIGCILLLFASHADAGSVTVKRKASFRSPFAEVVDVVREHRVASIIDGLRVVKETPTHAELMVQTPRFGERWFKISLNENVDLQNKTAAFKSKLVDTDGFIQDMSLTIDAVERNGETQADIVVELDVPAAPPRLLRMDVTRAMNKMIYSLRNALE